MRKIVELVHIDIDYEKYPEPCEHCGEKGFPLFEVMGKQLKKHKLCESCKDFLNKIEI